MFLELCGPWKSSELRVSVMHSWAHLSYLTFKAAWTGRGDSRSERHYYCKLLLKYKAFKCVLVKKLENWSWI